MSENKKMNDTTVGIIVSVAIVALMVFIVLVGNINLTGKGYEVTVKYKRLNNLKIDAQVRLAGGKKIGRVKNIDVGDDGKMHVVLQIEREIKLYNGMPFRQSTLGLMGDTYIDVGLISGTELMVPLENGSVVDGVDPFGFEMFADAGADTEDLARDVVYLIENMVQISEDLNATIGDSRDDLTSTIFNLRNGTYHLADSIDANQLRSTIEHLNVLSGNLRSITTQIRNRQGTLGKIIYEDTLFNKIYSTLDSTEEAMMRIKEQGVLGRERTN